MKTKCQAPLVEPVDTAGKDRVIRENAIRYGDCAGKVVILMKEVETLSK